MFKDKLRKLEEVLSLSSKYRPYIFIIVLGILFFAPISFLESSPDLSICHHLFGKYCYSVGITRGVSSLLKGNIQTAWNYNPLSFLVLLVMLTLIIFDLVKIFRPLISK